MSKLTSDNVVVGLDLGDRYSLLCVLDGEGEVVEETRIPTTEAAVRRWFEVHGSIRVALEVGTHSPWVSRLLETLGHEVIVANARQLGGAVACLRSGWRAPGCTQGSLRPPNNRRCPCLA